ncbi:MAG: glycoside hydrolase family 11 protein [Defluviitaleaceae bacterium]|nr:glycoside hydrolase family 11 protein [Defluviitaleaceae bacterium]
MKKKVAKRTAAFFTAIALVFAALMPFSAIQANTSVIWDLNEFLTGREPGAVIVSGNDALWEAGLTGDLTVNRHNNLLGLHAVNRTADFSGVDIRAAAGMQAGDVIIVTGRADGEPDAGEVARLVRAPGYAALASAVFTNRAFRLEHTLTQSEHDGLVALRINTTGTVSFFVDSIEIRRGAAPSPSPSPSPLPEGVERVITSYPNNRADWQFAQRVNGWDVEVWTQHQDGGTNIPNMGHVEMVVYTDGTFSAEWNNTFNSLFRTGRKFPRATSLESVGAVSIMYNVSEFTSNDTSYLGIYGWFRNPLIEWYIVDDWHQNWRPGGPVGSARANYTHHGILDIDGGRYDIYTGLRVNQPSIDGNRTFLQIFSVRHTPRQSGTIDVSAHFDAWMEIGEVTHTRGGTTHTANLTEDSELFEVAFNIEGFGGRSLSSGSSRVTKICISYGANALCSTDGCNNCATPTPTPTPSPTPESPTPEESTTEPTEESTTETPIMRFTIGALHFNRMGQSVSLDVAPFVDTVTNRTMIPFRVIAEGLGADVGWDEDTRTVHFTRSGVHSSIQIGTPLPGGMGEAVIIDGRTFVPIRFVSEELGSRVEWDGVNRAVYIY